MRHGKNRGHRCRDRYRRRRHIHHRSAHNRSSQNPKIPTINRSHSPLDHYRSDDIAQKILAATNPRYARR
jgi:hypothetical protein